MKADLLMEGSFDEAIQGVDGVFHTASPVLVPYDNNIQAGILLSKFSIVSRHLISLMPWGALSPLCNKMGFSHIHCLKHKK